MALEPTREGTVTLEGAFRLEAGGVLWSPQLRYVLYGEPNEAGDNVILVCHALSGSARVADWWPRMFGGVFDRERHCIVGINVLGSCYGSTGPTSTDPATALPYGPEFPLVSIRDMVRAQARVLEGLGIERLHTVFGGSIGGMQALQWAVDYPERLERCIAIGAAPLGAMGLALNHVQRLAIQLDPEYRGGRYDAQPAGGMALARAIAMCTYKSSELLDERFARRPNRNGEDPYGARDGRFDVAGYLDYQGRIFVTRFDANSYLALLKAMDTFDLARGYDSEREALRRIRVRPLLVGISSDWLFPPAEVRGLAQRLRDAGRPCDYAELRSPHGHDAFLADVDLLAPFVTAALWRPAAAKIWQPRAAAATRPGTAAPAREGICWK